MLACTWAPAVALRHFALPAFLLVAAIVFAPRLAGVGAAAERAAPALPALIGFFVLVGAGGVANHGADFAAMAGDFWHADVLVAPDRRPVLPAIAYMLPPWPAPYVVVWYAAFIGLFLAAWRFLRGPVPMALPRFALLTGSILAYLLIIPGYTEVLSFLVALLCWRADLTAAETCLAAALMIGGHEVAGGFAIAFLAIEATPGQRRAWLGSAMFLYGIYAAGYLLGAGTSIAHALDTATRPYAGHPMSSWQLDRAHPWRCLLGIAAAFKLLWLLLPAGFRCAGRARLHAACVMMAVPLVLVAADTSRIVQFASLSMLSVAAAAWPTVPRRARTALTIGMLVLPSVCAGTKAMPAWGKGLYALYLLIGQRFGVSLGGMAF